MKKQNESSISSKNSDSNDALIPDERSNHIEIGKVNEKIITMQASIFALTKHLETQENTIVSLRYDNE